MHDNDGDSVIKQQVPVDVQLFNTLLGMNHDNSCNDCEHDPVGDLIVLMGGRVLFLGYVLDQYARGHKNGLYHAVNHGGIHIPNMDRFESLLGLQLSENGA
jgi:hypothetical protein